MPMMESVTITVLLAGAMICGLMGRKGLALGSTLAAILASILFGLSSLLALLSLASFAGILEIRTRITHAPSKAILTIVSAVFAITLGMHVISGFGVITFGTMRFGMSEHDYVFGLGLDKWGVGAILLAYMNTLAGTVRSSSRYLWAAIALPPALIAFGVLMQVPFDMKANRYVLAFLALNLFVCATEEAFFRLLIQERLLAVVQPVLAWSFSGLLFFATHYSPQASAQALFIFLVAGFGYATVYSLTRSLSATILAHWASNGLHVLLLRYPL